MPRKRALDFRIDKLTRSIEEVATREAFETEIVEVNRRDSAQIRNEDWLFDWRRELLRPAHQIFKLIIAKIPNRIQGLMSLTDQSDHVFINLLENATFNIGEGKHYDGVAGNLVAFACKRAFQTGHGGIVAFHAKTALVKHYRETLGAQLFSHAGMLIDTKESLVLVERYFPDFKL